MTHAQPSASLAYVSRNAAVVLAAALLLSWVAFFNRAPLVFSDTIAYAAAALEGEVPGLFSIYYSWFILPFHAGRTLWPVVIVQGVIVGHLLALSTRCVLGRRPNGLTILLIVAALCAFSSLPWLTGEILPDVFSPVLVLNTFLLGFCADRLSRGELIYIEGLTALAIAAHFSHVPLAAGLIVLCLVLRMIWSTPAVSGMRAALLLVIPLVAATAAIVGANWMDSGRLVLAKNSNVFLLAKLLDEGPALRYLQRACPETHYALCAYLDRLPGMSHDDLKWGGASPFNELGGFDAFEPEARHIVWGTVRTYPLELLRRAAIDSGRQLLQFQTGDGLKPAFARMVGDYLSDVFGPGIGVLLSQSRQAQDDLRLPEFRAVHNAALLVGAAFCLWSFVRYRREMNVRLRAFYLFVPGAIVCSAVVTGALSAPYDRYLARVIWVLVFLALLSIAWQMQHRRRGARTHAPSLDAATAT
ncbi:MAG: hypothetical protein ACJ8F3_20180 [Xanthobacteraceae bacterium]